MWVHAHLRTHSCGVSLHMKTLHKLGSVVCGNNNGTKLHHKERLCELQRLVGRMMRGKVNMAPRHLKGMEHVEHKDLMVIYSCRTRDQEQHL